MQVHAGGQYPRDEFLRIPNYSLYTPRDFDVSRFFDIIKPRLNSRFDYRALQWGKDEVFADTGTDP